MKLLVTTIHVLSYFMVGTCNTNVHSRNLAAIPSSLPTVKPTSNVPIAINVTKAPLATMAPTFIQLTWFNFTASDQLFTSKNKDLDTMSMVYTLIINIVLFIFILLFFEYNRHYKQIFLKRYQKRFIDIGQVPDQPPDTLFGWFRAIWNVSETDVLHMVGLDAYMLLRFQAICIKLGLFLTFWGLLVLVPVYSTGTGTLTQWDKYTILNVASSHNNESKGRVWIAVIFSYIFAAYFCQVFYAEYDRFSTLRLSYLTKSDEVNPDRIDPDIMPQKDYTIMIEHIPPTLRSEHKLYEYFDDLFPNEIFTIEVSIDLRELHALVNKRNKIRNGLEMAIAEYITTGVRPVKFASTRKIDFLDILYLEDYQNKTKLYHERREDLQSYAPTHWKYKHSKDTSTVIVKRYLTHWYRVALKELFGLERVDAISYYIYRLEKLNDETKDVQEKFMEVSKKVDVDLQKRIKNKYDTRVAAALESLGVQGTNILEFMENQQAVDNALNNLAQIGKNSIKLKTPKGGGKGNTLQRMKNVLSSLKKSSSFSRSRASSTSELMSQQYTSEETPVGSKSVTYQSSAIKHDSIIQSPLHETSLETAATHTETVSMFSPDQRHDTSATQHHDTSSLHPSSTIGGGPPSPELSRTSSFHSLPPITTTTIHDDPPNTTSTTTMNKFRLHSHSINTTYSTEYPDTSVTAEFDDGPTTPSKLEKSKRLLLENAKVGGKEVWEQTKIAGTGALRGVIEAERAMEMILFGAYYKYSSTAFITFKTRTAEIIANQMMLDHDQMSIHHAPHPNDIIWENIAIPKSQINYRSFLMNIGLIIGSIFWSSLVTAIDNFAQTFQLPKNQENLVSVFVLLGFLLMLPFIFDTLARYYEGMKLESEIQNAIMTRYFYYQLVNIYVTVALKGIDVHDMVLAALRTPQTFVILLGQTIPAVSLYFVNLVVVKIFAAVPIEMLRPWQLSTILTLTNFMNRKKCTRRELRTGAFYAWPMLYGWVYPQLVIVEMIMIVYACIAPLLTPFCILFFIFTYLMYKYQLLYVYVNDYQSGGYMWYAVFNRSLLGLLFSSIALISFFSLDILNSYSQGPFLAMFPLPIAIIYFWRYTDSVFKRKMDLSFRLARQRDHRNIHNKEYKKHIPLDSFKEHFYRQKVMTEGPAYPEPYRKKEQIHKSYRRESLFDIISPMHLGGLSPKSSAAAAESRSPQQTVATVATTTALPDESTINVTKDHTIPKDNTKTTKSNIENIEDDYIVVPTDIDVYRVDDEVEDKPESLFIYYNQFVVPLSQPTDIPLIPVPTTNKNNNTTNRETKLDDYDIENTGNKMTNTLKSGGRKDYNKVTVVEDEYIPDI